MLYSAIAPALSLSPEGTASRSTGVIKQFVDLDRTFRTAQPKEQSGCTAIALALWETPTPGVRQLLVANAGDCRAVLCRRKNIGGGSTSVLQLSNDQTAEVPSEIARVQAAGGKIVRTADGRNRVQGHIQVRHAQNKRKVVVPGEML
jgi:serine/threonine protein phosphatase PrpC